MQGSGFGVVWCRPGVRFKGGSGGFGVVWCWQGVRFKEGCRGSMKVPGVAHAR